MKASLSGLRARVGEDVWRLHRDGLTQVILTLRIVSLKWRSACNTSFIQYFGAHITARSPAQWSLLQLLAVDKTNERLWELLETLYSSILHLDGRLTKADLRTVLGWQTTNGANIHFPPGQKRRQRNIQ